MFSFEMPVIPYSEPWNDSFDNRIDTLLKGDTKIAYLYEAPPKNTFRYRVYNMVQVLNHSQGFSASYFPSNDWDELEKKLAEIDVLVVSRLRYTGELNQLIARAHSRKKKVFFDIDDLIFDPDYTHLIVQTLDLPRTEHTWNYWFAFISRIRASIQLCDGVITTNKFLASEIETYFKKPTFVIPNFMNEQQLEISQQIFEKKKHAGWLRDNFITLGYFSGTQTHNKDFEVASTALAELFASDERLRLRVGGHLEIHGPMKKFAARVDLLPFRDFVNLQTAVGEVNINLVPLQENIFSNCKSELKYFEAAAVGTITLASPIYSYAHAIEDGKNGYLSESYAWLDKLTHVIESMENYQSVAETAMQDACVRYSWTNQTELLQKTLLSL